MKLFQIEEPGGASADPALPGAAVGIDLSGTEAVVAFSVGGNAVELREREEFVRNLPVPTAAGIADDWQALFEGVRLRAERLLGQPVTHAVVAIAAAPSTDTVGMLRAAAAAAGIEVLDVLGAAELPATDGLAVAAALAAEDLMPRLGIARPAAAYFS